MAVTFDAVTAIPETSGTTQTISHTVGSGTTRLLIVAVTVANSSRTVSSITFDGVSMTQVPSARQNEATNGSMVDLWYLIAPASGAKNVVVTISASGRFQGGAVSFDGVDQTTPLGTAVGTTVLVSSNTITNGSVTSTTDDMIIGAAFLAASSGTFSVSDTQRWSTNSSTFGEGQSMGQTSATANDNITFNTTVSFGSACSTAVPVKAAAAAAGGGPIAGAGPLSRSPLFAGRLSI